MNDLAHHRFAEFFEALYGHQPYPWQRRLAEAADAGRWPSQLALPTGSGKTSVIDIAIFVLACSAGKPLEARSAARRILFCVDRRIIVDEAHDRALRIARHLFEAERAPAKHPPILAEVAAALRRLAGSTPEDGSPPLDVLELRGGIYRDNRWARSATQPTVICSTIDQIGSRLLFRGYGVSSGAAPIQAALLAYDSILFLDEAHISAPFQQTLDAVQRLIRGSAWTSEPISVQPIRVVPMSATLGSAPGDAPAFGLEAADLDDTRLARRLRAIKPTLLMAATRSSVEDDVVREVLTALSVQGPRRGAAASDGPANPVAIGVIVNRVATARAIHAQVVEALTRDRSGQSVHVDLVIGSMRPIDRDRQVERLRPLVGPDRPAITSRSSVVVATQCLEVGADYDFDVLITECASIDALRQRFGRLNRAGRDVTARGVVIAGRSAIREDARLDDARPADPIYGNAAARTWNWLQSKASDKVIDFGVEAFARLLEGEDPAVLKGLLSPTAQAKAPTLLPEFLDFWCQTAPRPVPDPSVDTFLRGPEARQPDVRVCWRADLEPASASATVRSDGLRWAEAWADAWSEVLSLMPPTSAECMPVPISTLRRWLLGESSKQDDLGDAFDGDRETADSRDGAIAEGRIGLIWRGPDEVHLLEHVRQLNRPAGTPDRRCLRPGDIVVFPASVAGAGSLGHIPALAAHRGSEQTVASKDFDVAPEPIAEGQARGQEQAGGSEGIDAGSADNVEALDVAERSFRRSTSRTGLRTHPNLKPCGDLGGAVADLFSASQSERDEWTLAEWRGLLEDVEAEIADLHLDEPSGAAPRPMVGTLRERLKFLRRQCQDLLRLGFQVEPYPDRSGFVLLARRADARSSLWVLPALDDGDGWNQRQRRTWPVGLAEHTAHVVDEVVRQCEVLPLEPFEEALTVAARIHDLGKVDERFQAVLFGTDRTDARMFLEQGRVLAKSAATPSAPASQERLRQRAQLPQGFRHEMASMLLAQWDPPRLAGEGRRDLLLHLVSAHHGEGRPFAPVVVDPEPPELAFGAIAMPAEERRALPPPHRIDSGVADRFWTLVRRHGWWGIAYLEAVLRLADQQASRLEDLAEDPRSASAGGARCSQGDSHSGPRSSVDVVQESHR